MSVNKLILNALFSGGKKSNISGNLHVKYVLQTKYINQFDSHKQR